MRTTISHRRPWIQVLLATAWTAAATLATAAEENFFGKHTGKEPSDHRWNKPVLATPATCDLCGVLLPDSGYLQEEDARFYNKHRISKHRPALPLYTEEQARESLKLLRPAPRNGEIRVHESITVRFWPAGHILGASFVEVRLRVSSRHEKVVLFSGDLGPDEKTFHP